MVIGMKLGWDQGVVCYMKWTKYNLVTKVLMTCNMRKVHMIDM